MLSSNGRLRCQAAKRLASCRYTCLARSSTLAGKPVTDDALRASIAVYNANRRAVQDLYTYRARKPWQAPTSEVYLVIRAGMVLPPEEHTALIREYLACCEKQNRPKRDNTRIVLT